MASRSSLWVVGALVLAASTAGPAELRGRVLVDGSPAEGITVSVLPFEDGARQARREARGEGAAIHGTISGLPESALAGIPVNASGPDGYFASTRAGSDASFELTGVPEGSIRLGATAGDFANRTRVAHTSVTIGPGQADAYAEIVFEAGYRVEVRVSRSGQPAADAFVNAFPESGAGRSASARTDEMGTCVLEGLPLDSQGRGEVPSVKPGSYELRVSSSGYAPVVRPGIMVPSSELAFALTPGGTLEIQVGPDTQALPHPQGRLYGADGRPYLASIFSTDGVIPLGGPVRRVENVAAGRYAFVVEGGARQEVDVREGGQAVVVLP